jgi:PhnB protein
MTSAIPGNYRRITPCLVVRGSVRALEFYTALFGAKVRMNFPAPDGTIAHAEMEIGDLARMYGGAPMKEECP